MTKILFVRYKKNNGVLDGGEQVTEMHYSTLCNIVGKDHVVTYYIHSDDKKRSLMDYLRGALYLPFGYYFGLTPSKVRKLYKIAQSCDIVFIDRSVFGILAKKLKAKGFQGRIITFFHNVEALYFDSKISKRLPFRRLVIRCADKNDGYSCRYSDRTIALNQRDNNLLAQRYHKEADALIPIVFKDLLPLDAINDELTHSQPHCLFIGSYFAPNVEGLLWFTKNVFPHVDIHLKVVGKGMERLKEEEESLRDIEVIGSVPDMAPYILDADIMILPIFKGSGMKVKTCESLMYGRNILGTDEAFEGYDADYEQIGGKCNTYDDFISKINEFIATPRPRFNAYSRKVYLERYSETIIDESMRRVLFV